MQCFSLKISPYRILVDVLRFPGASSEESTWNVGAQVWSPGPEDPLEKEMATRSTILSWEIPWTEEPGGLQAMELEESAMT